MSYADVAAKGPKQTPEEAAAPQPPQIVHSETASTASLIDVDAPSVRTVPSDFLEQDVQTETQAVRREQEHEAAKAKAAAESAAAKARAEKDLAKKRARRADAWLVNQLSSLSDGSLSAIVIGNLAAVVGLSAYLGYRAWGLYDRGRLTWKSVGLGLGVLGVVGAFEGVFATYIQKAEKNKKK